MWITLKRFIFFILLWFVIFSFLFCSFSYFSVQDVRESRYNGAVCTSEFLCMARRRRRTATDSPADSKDSPTHIQTYIQPSKYQYNKIDIPMVGKKKKKKEEEPIVSEVGEEHLPMYINILYMYSYIYNAPDHARKRSHLNAACVLLKIASRHRSEAFSNCGIHHVHDSPYVSFYCFSFYFISLIYFYLFPTNLL